MFDQYECLVKLIENIESAKYTIEKVVQAIKKLDFGEDTCNINQYIKKRMQNNDISEIINISPAVYHMLQNFQSTSASVERSFPCWKNCWPRTKILRSRMCDVTWFYTFMRPSGDYTSLQSLADYVPRLDLFCDRNSLVYQVSLGKCVCFRLLNICFNIKSQKKYRFLSLNFLGQ